MSVLKFVVFALCLLTMVTRTNASLAKMRAERHCEDLHKELQTPAHKKHVRTLAKTGHFWSDWWHPTWSCLTERKVKDKMPLGEGGKWICDTPVLSRQKEVLIYSFGSHGDLSFELGMEKVAPGIEAHVFDFYSYGKTSMRNITFHKLGVAGYTYDHVFPDPENEPIFKGRTFPKESVPMKSIPDIVRQLGHQGRTIDILKIDIEGNEYGILDNSTMWQELASLGVTVRQIQLELHLGRIGKRSLLWKDATAVPGEVADGLLRVLHDHGFVMFHKEVNLLPGLLGTEYSFLKVRPISLPSP